MSPLVGLFSEEKSGIDEFYLRHQVTMKDPLFRLEPIIDFVFPLKKRFCLNNKQLKYRHMLCHQIGNDLAALLLIDVGVILKARLPAMTQVLINCLHLLRISYLLCPRRLHSLTILRAVERVRNF